MFTHRGGFGAIAAAPRPSVNDTTARGSGLNAFGLNALVLVLVLVLSRSPRPSRSSPMRTTPTSTRAADKVAL
eukprot:4950504-Pyramimonas_sp.AAC.1